MKSILLTLSLALPFGVFAQTYTIHSQPNGQSQVIGQVNDQSNVTQIFRKGQWLEVVNNDNGQTGWVNIQPAQTQANQYQMMLSNIRHQRAMLKHQMAVMQEKFHRAFKQLDAREQQLMQQQPAPQAKPNQTPYTFTSTQVSCTGKTGKKVTKYVWTDKAGHQHQKTVTKKMSCS